MATATYNSKDLGRNLLLFEGMTYYNGMAPTDIDFFMEVRDKIYVYGEFKHKSCKSIPVGQKIAFTRVVDNSKAPAISFFAKHDQDGDVIAKDCEIAGVYFNEAFAEQFGSSNAGKWLSKGWNKLTAGQLIIQLSKKFGFAAE